MILRAERTVRQAHRVRDGYILDLRVGYVYQWLQAWNEADDGCNDGRITAHSAACVALWAIESDQSEKYVPTLKTA